MAPVDDDAASPEAAGEHEVAGAELVHCDSHAGSDLLLGGSGEGDSDLLVGPLDEAAAVEADAGDEKGADRERLQPAADFAVAS